MCINCKRPNRTSNPNITHCRKTDQQRIGGEVDTFTVSVPTRLFRIESSLSCRATPATAVAEVAATGAAFAKGSSGLAVTVET